MKQRERPINTCMICGVPFTWRTKWARCREKVRYCLELRRRSILSSGSKVVI
ncbi:DUF2256 domain-containing protein [Pseudomonas sp.]|uniref:DUF2256 domain-containing protein n=1 Tax=Pseudomonas sp. TaxID=306 RepID=UPI003FD892B9